MLRIVEEESEEKVQGELPVLLDEIAREGARRILEQALEEEVPAYLANHAGARDEAGHRLVVRNEPARPRKVTLGPGRWRCRHPGWTTTGWTRRASASDSPRDLPP